MRITSVSALAVVTLPALALATTAYAPDRDYGGYVLDEVSSEAIDTRIPPADGSKGLPERLQGLWWMDGNPLPDEIVSFANSEWNARERKTSIAVFDEDIWSWHGSEQGRALYDFVRKFELVYELSFDEGLNLGEITPVVRIQGREFRVPKALVRFTARYAGDGHFIRESYFFGQLAHTYDFRRVVKADGTREKDYDAYVEQAPDTSLVARKVR